MAVVIGKVIETIPKNGTPGHPGETMFMVRALIAENKTFAGGNANYKIGLLCLAAFTQKCAMTLCGPTIIKIGKQGWSVTGSPFWKQRETATHNKEEWGLHPGYGKEAAW